MSPKNLAVGFSAAAVALTVAGFSFRKLRRIKQAKAVRLAKNDFDLAYETAEPIAYRNHWGMADGVEDAELCRFTNLYKDDHLPKNKTYRLEIDGHRVLIVTGKDYGPTAIVEKIGATKKWFGFGDPLLMDISYGGKLLFDGTISEENLFFIVNSNSPTYFDHHAFAVAKRQNDLGSIVTDISATMHDIRSMVAINRHKFVSNIKMPEYPENPDQLELPISKPTLEERINAVIKDLQDNPVHPERRKPMNGSFDPDYDDSIPVVPEEEPTDNEG